MSVARAELHDVSGKQPSAAVTFLNRISTLWLVELKKLSHDRTELFTRAIQPALWLLIFGETFTRIHAIPTGGVRYLDYLAPGIMAQSAMFIAIFYGIVTIWERDAGVLAKLMATPTSRSALVVGKAFAASVRAVAQVIVVLALSLILGVHLDWNALHLLVALILIVLGVGFFTTLSISVAGLALKQERLMGIGQAITMPLFFGSNALYPVKLMPGWLQVISHVNPLTYMVDGLRVMLIRTSGHVLLDLVVLVAWLVLGIAVAARLLPRLVR
jgi:ABC-2 type transport system permease protein